MKTSGSKLNDSNLSKGFTLVELLLIMGIIAVLTSFAVMNLIRPQTKASLDTVVTSLVSDIKSQQLKAMAGDSGSGSTSQPQGLYIQTNQYTLFKGSSYSGADTDNFVVTENSDISLSTTFPSSIVIFSKRSGEVSGFSNGSNTVTVSSGGESKIITVNRYGAVSIQ